MSGHQAHSPLQDWTAYGTRPTGPPSDINPEVIELAGFDAGQERAELGRSEMKRNVAPAHHSHEAMLRADNIRRVYITGFVLDVCVYETAVSAIALGFDTYIVLDATKPAYPDQLEETMAKIRDAGIKVIYSADLLARSELRNGD